MTEGDRSVSATPAARTASHQDRVTALERLAHVGTFELLDAETGAARWSAESWRILGLEPRDEVPRYRDSVHPADRADVLAVVSRCLQTGQDQSTEHRIIRPDGEVRWLTARLAPVIDPGSGAVTGLFGIAMDVTDAHQARADRDLAEETLRIGFAGSPVGFGVTDTSGQLLVVNAAYCDIVGRPEQEILGVKTIDLVHPDDRSHAVTPRDAMVAGELDVFEAENRIVRPDGELRWVHRTVSIIRDPEREPAFLTQLHDVTERKLATDRISHLAFSDTLTGLANRQVLGENTDRALREVASGGGVTCVFLDIDDFKVINDGLGHAAGDRLLGLVARRLEQAVRPGDTLARFGGDEFVIVRTALEAEDGVDPQCMGDEVAAAMTAPFDLLGRSVSISVSVGVATSRDAASTEALLRDADSAMYRAKELGRNHVVVFDAELARAVADRLDIEAGLRTALLRDELTMHYQPVVELATGRVMGVEALLRWQHPSDGLIGPDRFIAVAEQTGLVVPIGEWVIRESLRALRRWRATVPGAAALWVAVNVSARQLHDAALVPTVLAELTAAQLPPAALHLEMTESVMMGDHEAEVLEDLCATGLHLVVDDFGTGYSSLSYLTRLPVSTLKLDRCFVAGLNSGNRRDRAVVTAVIGLGHALSLTTVAEGVERADQLIELVGLGMEYGQGWLWSPARSADELTPWLAANLAGE